MAVRLFLLGATLALAPSSATFFSQSPCSGGCGGAGAGGLGSLLPSADFLHLGGGCPQPVLQPPCPVQPPPVCPQHPPCPEPAAAATSVIQQLTQQPSLVDRFVQPLQQLQNNYVQQPAGYVTDVAGVNPSQQPTVIYLDQITGNKIGDSGKRPQVVYQSLPTGGSRLIVPPGSDVYALNTGAGSSYQYENPTVVYHTDQLPSTAAVNENIDEMDLKGLEWGIPLQATEQQTNTLNAIELLAENPDLVERTLARRKSRALNDDVISQEEEEEKDYGDLISSDEEVEMIGDGEEEEDDDTIAAANKIRAEKNKKRRRSSARARQETKRQEVSEVEQDNDMDRKKCNSRRLYEIMLENMNESSASSKRTINSVAEAEFGTSIDVICSRGHFSYVFSSNLYCEASKGHVTCIAFRQAPPAGPAPFEDDE